MADCLEPSANSQAITPELAALPLARRVGFLSHKLAQLLLSLFEAKLSPLKLTTRTYFILSAVDRDPPLSQQELARILGIDPTTIVTLVDDLERVGYLKRARNSADRRRYDLRLTALGRRTLTSAHRAADAAEEEFFAPLNRQELSKYVALVQQVLAARWPAPLG
ncbi:MAG: MarR family transcriptional regulator [Acidothermus sp.]|nr:MarR family transcriptional regulator [Acidothermus sp.]